MRLLVTVTGLEPGAPLDAAVALADALDARRVPATLLVGPRPHPEVAAWSAARRRAGDATLLHGTGPDERTHPRLRDHRLPAHEAGLRLAGAVRTRDALGLPVDGFAAPDWTISDGTRRALGRAGVDLVVDTSGVHRLDQQGSPVDSCLGAVAGPGAPVRPARARLRTLRRRPGAPVHPVSPRAASTGLTHVTLALGRSGGRSVIETALAAVDAALHRGAVPAVPAALVPTRPSVRRPHGADPELWSITA